MRRAAHIGSVVRRRGSRDEAMECGRIPLLGSFPGPPRVDSCALFSPTDPPMQRVLVLAAALVAATGFSLRAQAPQEQIKELRRQVDKLNDQLVAERANLLTDLRVNGLRLDPREVMREAVYLTGGKLVEAKVASFFILEELKKQVDSGLRKAADFIVTDEDVLNQLQPLMGEFSTKN